MNLQTLQNWAGTTDELFDQLTHELAAAGRWHELFEARLIEARARLGLSVTRAPALDDLPEPQRTTLEQDYTAACSEVGGLLVDAGRLREAWHYLRPAGEKHVLRAALARALPNSDNVEELIELALYEGIDAERGFGWMLGHYGTCNAITTLDGLAPRLEPTELTACAAALLRHVYRELRESVGRHIRQRESSPPPEHQSLAEWIAGRDWLFEAEASHLDASHLAATVRFARVLTGRRLVEMALDLTEYGSRLDPALQYAGDPPFDDLYDAHRWFFLATLGREVEPAVDYFRQRAEEADPYTEGTAAIETLLVLLHRTDDASAALAAYEELVPRDVRLTQYAPALIELAADSGDWERYDNILKDRDDPVGIAIGKLVRMAAS